MEKKAVGNYFFSFSLHSFSNSFLILACQSPPVFFGPCSLMKGLSVLGEFRSPLGNDAGIHYSITANPWGLPEDSQVPLPFKRTSVEKRKEKRKGKWKMENLQFLDLKISNFLKVLTSFFFLLSSSVML